MPSLFEFIKNNVLAVLICFIVVMLVLNTLTLQTLFFGPIKIMTKQLIKMRETGKLFYFSRQAIDEISLLQMQINENIKLMVQQEEDQKILLDHIGDGLFYFNQDGTISTRCSRSCYDIFGEDISHGNVWEIFKMTPEHFHTLTQVIFLEDLQGQNFEAKRKLLPFRLNSKNKTLEFRYRPIYSLFGKQKLEHILVVVKDVTQIYFLEEEKRKKEHDNLVLIRILHHREEFFHLIEEIRQVHYLVEDNEKFLLSIHTIKGSLSFFGPTDLVKICHDLELETNLEKRRSGVNLLNQLLTSYLEHNQDLINGNLEKTITLSTESFENFIQNIEKASLDEKEKEKLRLLFYVPLEKRMDWAKRALARLVERAKKKAHPLKFHGQLFIPPTGGESIFHSMLHIMTNFVDHGLESPRAREKKGLDPLGSMEIFGREQNDHYEIIFANDGLALDLDRIKQAAKEKNLIIHDEDKIEHYIFHKGITTQKENQGTETSGRGIGLMALREVLRNAGGDVVIETTDSQKGLDPKFTLALKVTIPKKIFFSSQLNGQSQKQDMGKVIPFSNENKTQTRKVA